MGWHYITMANWLASQDWSAPPDALGTTTPYRSQPVFESVYPWIFAEMINS